MQTAAADICLLQEMIGILVLCAEVMFEHGKSQHSACCLLAVCHADPEEPPKALDSSRQLAIKARNASRTLQALSSDERGKLLYQIADAIESKQDVIMAENDKDCQVQFTVGMLCGFL